MNERIQGLQIRAVRLVADDCANGDVFRLNTGSQQVQNLISQKFAELIVRECIYQVNKSNYSSGDEWTLWDEAMTCAANNIREHFGVEE